MEDRQYEHLLREIVASRRHTDEGLARLGAELRAEMRQQGEGLRTGLRAEMRQQGEEWRAELRSEMHQQGEELRAELRSEMRQQGEELRAEMRSEMRQQGEELRAEMRQQGTDLRGEMSQQGTDLRCELIAYVDASAAETRRHSAVVAEGLRSEIQHLAEGLAGLEEKTDRRFEELRAEMREGFAGTHALIRVSYQDLDQRLRRVEEAGR